jgi:hypothetical protein
MDAMPIVFSISIIAGVVLFTESKKETCAADDICHAVATFFDESDIVFVKIFIAGIALSTDSFDLLTLADIVSAVIPADVDENSFIACVIIAMFLDARSKSFDAFVITTDVFDTVSVLKADMTTAIDEKAIVADFAASAIFSVIDEESELASPVVESSSAVLFAARPRDWILLSTC